MHTLDKALNQLLQLRGVSFEWKDPQKFNHKKGAQVGFIAQEVEKLFPQWVHEGNDGFKRVNYTGIEGLLVEAIRELKNSVDELKAENKLLKEEIEKLK